MLNIIFKYFFVLSFGLSVPAAAFEVSGSLSMYLGSEDPYLLVQSNSSDESYYVVQAELAYDNCKEGVFDLLALPPNYDTFEMVSFHCYKY